MPGSPLPSTATGAEHIPLPPEADFDDREDLVFPEREGLKGAKAIAFDIEHVFVRPGRAQHDAIIAAHRDEPAEALLTDPAFSGGAFLLGHPLGERPPLVVCGVIPLMIASRDTAPYGMGLQPMRGPLGRLRNALLSALAARTVFPRAERLAREVNRELHGRPLPFPVLDWPRHAEAIVQFTVPEFEYPRSDAPGDPALRRSGLGHRLRSAAAALVGRPRRLDAGRPRHPGHDREPRLPADHRPDARGARRGRRARGRVHRRAPPRSTRSGH